MNLALLVCLVVNSTGAVDGERPQTFRRLLSLKMPDARTTSWPPEWMRASAKANSWVSRVTRASPNTQAPRLAGAKEDGRFKIEEQDQPQPESPSSILNLVP